MWGRGPIGSNGACSILCRISVTPSATHNQSGPFWCCFPSRWVCLHSRPLWVSPTDSPVRLGVSPTAASTPKGFSIRGLRLYFPTGALGCSVCFTPPLCLPVYLHVNMGLQGPPATVLPRVLSTQLHISAPPTGLDECVFFNSLAVGLPQGLIFC